jgi:hypothetical protein
MRWLFRLHSLKKVIDNLLYTVIGLVGNCIKEGSVAAADFKRVFLLGVRNLLDESLPEGELAIPALVNERDVAEVLIPEQRVDIGGVADIHAV